MRSKKSVKTYKQETVNVVILVAILCLFVYLGIQFSRNFSDTVSTQRTQTVTEVDYISLTGYVFKDETVLGQETAGITDHLVANGEKLSVGTVYARFYAMKGSDGDLRQTQGEINDLTDQIALLRDGSEGGRSVSDLAKISRTLSTTYYSYVDSILDGDFSSANGDGDRLLGALVDYTVITGRDGATESIVSLLEERKQAVLQSANAVPKALTADQSCYFYRNTDGYEEVFSSARLEGMTVADLNELILTEPAEHDSKVIGKLTHTPKWFLAVPTNEAVCLQFTAGMTYPISRKGGGGEVDMLLERIVIEEEGAYLLFSCYDLTVSNDFFRSQDVRVRMGSTTGYRIPEDALSRVGAEDGVYILIGNMIEFRRVTVIGEGNGYIIVNTYERDQASGAVSSIPYLYEGDLIITSGNHLYDGMMLK